MHSRRTRSGEVMSIRMILLSLLALASSAFCADAPAPKKEGPPSRAFDAPGFPTFTRLDGKPGVNPPADADGDFLLGPEYQGAPEWKVVDGVPQGKVQQFTINSK